MLQNDLLLLATAHATAAVAFDVTFAATIVAVDMSLLLLDTVIMAIFLTLRLQAV